MGLERLIIGNMGHVTLVRLNRIAIRLQLLGTFQRHETRLAETFAMPENRKRVAMAFLASNYNMARLRNFAAVLIGAFGIMLGTAFNAEATQAAVANPTEVYVQHNIDIGYAILNDPGLSDAQRRTQFRSFILSLTDPRRIGMFTLGQYANGASMIDIEAFITAFTDYVVALYEARLNKYRNQTIRVSGSVQRTSDDMVVSADVVNPSTPLAQPIKAAFRVRKTANGRPIVTDIQVEGVWLALSERSDFVGFLQQHHGSISALREDLITRTEQLRSTPK